MPNLPTPPSTGDDPYLWLEDVDSTQALDWVRAQNLKAHARLAESAPFKAMQADLLAVLDSDSNIPYVEKIGAHYYNFWVDAAHPRGLWRRTTLAQYRKAQPAWETVLDIDALNALEGENWVWHGADCLHPGYQRALVALSRGGADASVTREFDLVEKAWVNDGFELPESKGGLGWAGSTTTTCMCLPTSVQTA